MSRSPTPTPAPAPSTPMVATATPAPATTPMNVSSLRSADGGKKKQNAALRSRRTASPASMASPASSASPAAAVSSSVASSSAFLSAASGSSSSAPSASVAGATGATGRPHPPRHNHTPPSSLVPSSSSLPSLPSSNQATTRKSRRDGERIRRSKQVIADKDKNKPRNMAKDDGDARSDHDREEEDAGGGEDHKRVRGKDDKKKNNARKEVLNRSNRYGIWKTCMRLTDKFNRYVLSNERIRVYVDPLGLSPTFLIVLCLLVLIVVLQNSKQLLEYVAILLGSAYPVLLSLRELRASKLIRRRQHDQQHAQHNKLHAKDDATASDVDKDDTIAIRKERQVHYRMQSRLLRYWVVYEISRWFGLVTIDEDDSLWVIPLKFAYIIALLMWNMLLVRGIYRKVIRPASNAYLDHIHHMVLDLRSNFPSRLYESCRRRRKPGRRPSDSGEDEDEDEGEEGGEEEDQDHDRNGRAVDVDQGGQSEASGGASGAGGAAGRGVVATNKTKPSPLAA